MEKKNADLQHLAIIMDGNGRWAESHGLPRLMGHKKGAQILTKVIKACAKRNIPYLTVYAFSTENWLRPASEVSHLLSLFDYYLRTAQKKILENNIRFRLLGDTQRLPNTLQKRVQHLEEISCHNTHLLFQVAFNYGGRDELVRGIKKIARAVEDGTLSWKEINKQILENNLYTKGLPDPDLLIRTGGEKRLSNYLLWQMAYTELLFLKKYWPNFTVQDLDHALASFRKRSRRFGSTEETTQLHPYIKGQHMPFDAKTPLHPDTL